MTSVTALRFQQGSSRENSSEVAAFGLQRNCIATASLLSRVTASRSSKKRTFGFRVTWSTSLLGKETGLGCPLTAGERTRELYRLQQAEPIIFRELCFSAIKKSQPNNFSRSMQRTGEQTQCSSHFYDCEVIRILSREARRVAQKTATGAQIRDTSSAASQCGESQRPWASGH